MDTAYGCSLSEECLSLEITSHIGQDTGHTLPQVIKMLFPTITFYMGQDTGHNLPILIWKLSPARTSYVGQYMGHDIHLNNLSFLVTTLHKSRSWDKHK